MEFDKIGNEDLNILRNFKSKSEAALANAKAAVAESKTADLEYRNQILRIFLSYRLSLDDGFDEMTGVITRKQDTPPVVVETPAGAAPVVESTPTNA